jgi:predicted transcriptional regulator YdeE
LTATIFVVQQIYLNKMSNQIIQAFKVIGISKRTTNEVGQSSREIPVLWERFMAENMLAKIPNKINDAIYCIYTNYEKDHTKSYDTILGCKVSTVEIIPEGMVVCSVEEATYTKYVAEGNLLEGVVFKEWTKIWNDTLARTFTADFEVYDQKAQNPADAVVDIFIAIE